jgi:hypothetical protein
LHPSKSIGLNFIWYLSFACFGCVVIKQQKREDCKENGLLAHLSLDFGV